MTIEQRIERIERDTAAIAVAARMAVHDAVHNSTLTHSKIAGAADISRDYLAHFMACLCMPTLATLVKIHDAANGKKGTSDDQDIHPL